MTRQYTRRNVVQSTIGLAAASAAGLVVGRVTLSTGRTPPTVIAAPALAATTRNALTQPFTPQSIWNQPIGSNARYVPAGFGSSPRSYAAMPFSDPMRICLTPTAPPTQIRYSSAAWTGANRCSPTSSQVLATVPMPANFIVANSNKNEAGTFLAADRHTLVSGAPFTRCSAGGLGTMVTRNADADIYGDGAYGAHGGSKLSAIGGVLRLTEMRPGGVGAPHALNLTIGTGRFLYRATKESDTFRWPALTSDSGALGYYGSETNNQISAMKMGVLLALPPSSTLPTTARTAPGKQLAWTFQNYGAYVTDGTGADDFLISTEEGQAGSFLSQFQSDWGFSFEQRYTTSAVSWSRDVVDILGQLCAVDNNSPTSIGGGGTPRQPLAAPISATNPPTTTTTTPPPVTTTTTTAPTTTTPPTCPT